MSEKRPYVTFNSPDIQVVAMRKTGWAATRWIIQWQRRGESMTNEFEIDSSIIGGSNAGGFRVEWGD
jgi:hypothetical protein